MGLTIEFGIMQDEGEGEEVYQRVVWPGKGFKTTGNDIVWEGKEDDGTSEELSWSSGRNYRDMRYSDASQWRKDVKQVKWFFDRFENGSDCHTPLDDELMTSINLIPLSGTALNIDRAIWLKYWAKRAREEFGDKAVISFH